jgi:ubiquinone/menaquinone biosynthesis C-methylase UbiE
MCGSGRFLIPLLERGLDIDGVDASPHMLQACRNHCAKLGITPVLHEQFIERITFSRQYDLVIIPASSFCLVIERKDVEESLRRIYALMTPAGKFVVEVELHRQRPSESRPWEGRWVERPDGAKIVLSSLSHYDAKDHLMHSINRYDLIKNGQLFETEFEDFNLRYYDLIEFDQLLEAAGFQDRKALKLYTFSAADETDRSVVFECSKH